ESVAEPCGALGYCMEHWLDVRRGARDGTENLAGRRLLGERLRQLCIAHFQFLEQSHVLNRDYRLAREGLQQLNLGVREWAWLPPHYADGAHSLAVAQHWDRNQASIAEQAAGLSRELRHRRRFDVRDLDHRSREDRNAQDALVVEGSRESRPHGQ